MTEVVGIDHIYITVSDLNRSEVFYDHVLLEALGFRKNKFTLGDDPHVADSALLGCGSRGYATLGARDPMICA